MILLIQSYYYRGTVARKILYDNFFFIILLTEKSFFLKKCLVKFEYVGFLDIITYDANNSTIKNEWNTLRTCFQMYNFKALKYEQVTPVPMYLSLQMRTN